MKTRTRIVQTGLIFGLLAFTIALTRAGTAAATVPDASSNPASTGASLATFLAPDGTLALPPGFSGSLDARGWSLVSGENEPPRFASLGPAEERGAGDAGSENPRVSGDEKWTAGFGPTGVNGAVHALVAGENGDVFIGGEFYAAGSVAAARIAKWDGTNWSALGGGFDNTVYGLAYDPVNHRLYAGGTFRHVCDTPDCASTPTPVNYIAMWSAGAWHPLGDPATGVNGVNGPVVALALDEDQDLYVGGNFGGYCTNSDCSTKALTYYVAKWTWTLGGQWSALGSGSNIGVNGYVCALAWSGTGSKGTLYVGGWFSAANAAATVPFPANNVAAYTRSTNSWSALTWNGMNGVDYAVFALALDSKNSWLYIGGAFTYICGNDACNTSGPHVNRIARWDTGSSGWSLAQMGSPGWYGLNGTVNALAVDANQNLFVGGDFTAFNSINHGGSPVSHVAQWNGSWSALGGGIQSANSIETVWALLASGTGLIAGGNFQFAEGRVTTGIARWDGARWASLYAGNGAGPTVAKAVAADGKGNVYVGGDFLTAGGIRVNHIAQWDGTHWSALGNGLSGYTVNALAIDEAGNLYAGGDFQNVCADPNCAPGTQVRSVARWDPASHNWFAVSYGIVGWAYALVLDRDGNLYAGGWLGPICKNVDCSNYALMHNLARWDRATGLWSSVSFGVQGEVNSLAVDNSNNLYIAFQGTDVCADAACSQGLTVNHIAGWDGKNWFKLGQGLTGDVNSLVVDSSNNLYAGGAFWTICADETCSQSIKVNCIARWNGSTWSKVGQGLDNWVYSLAIDESNNIFAGGVFQNVCTNEACSSKTPARYIAKWNKSVWSALGSGIGPRPASVAPVASLAWRYGKVSVGGHFSTGGNKVSANFAQYLDNNPPTLSNIAKTGRLNTLLHYSTTDFTSALSDAESEPLAKIQVLSLPANGTLTLGGTAVTVSQEIPEGSLANLAFAPKSGWTGTTSFGWNGHDGNSYALSSANVNISVQNPVVNTPKLYLPLLRR